MTFWTIKFGSKPEAAECKGALRPLASQAFIVFHAMKTYENDRIQQARQDLLDWDAEFGLRFVKAYMG